eukprot:1151953-Pelagomonas_calceolata.AAC.2
MATWWHAEGRAHAWKLDVRRPVHQSSRQSSVPLTTHLCRCNPRILQAPEQQEWCLFVNRRQI